MFDKKIVLGCMGFGGAWDHESLLNSRYNIAEMAIETALEEGIQTFDHADFYCFGKSEEVFGQVLANKPSLRDKMIVQSKAGIIIGKGLGGSSIYNNSQKYIINQVESSLSRLNVDYLDQLLIHRPDPLVQYEELAETFQILKDRQLVHRFGVSNMSVDQIRCLNHFWPEPLVANQLQFSLGHAYMLDIGVNVNTTNLNKDYGLHGMVEYAQMSQMPLQAWGPLDKGLYSGRPMEQLTADQQATSKFVQLLADKYGVNATTIVTAWVLQLPASIQPVIGTTQPERIRSAVRALEIGITREEWYDLWLSVRGVQLP